MSEAFIVDIGRTPVGKHKGQLADQHPIDMAALTIKTIVERNNIDPAAIDDVILGCTDNIGPNAGDIARTAALAAGLPETVPGVTLDRQCGSSQQAVHFAAQGVMSGTADVIFAGGVQMMSAVPFLISYTAAREYGFENPYDGSKAWAARYGTEEISQFRGADMIAEHWGISRLDMEKYALESHRRAISAIANGNFKNEIIPVGDIDTDQGPRDTSLEKMAKLSPIRENGLITAAVSSQISDAASGCLVASERAVEKYGLTPRARIRQMAVIGADPIYVLTAPIPATKKVLAEAGLTIDDIDVFEVNEAFAPVVLAWMKELGVDPDRVNPNGGGIALGHPIGATGTKLMSTLVNELERSGGRYGLQVMCEGGGQANATIIERV